MDIILHLLYTIQVLYQQNCWLLQFICRYLPLKQWAFDDSHSPRYQKYKVDELPVLAVMHLNHFSIKTMVLKVKFFVKSAMPNFLHKTIAFLL